MKKWKIIALSIVGMVLISTISIGEKIQQTEDNFKKQSYPSKIEILDIKYSNGKIIATVHSEVSYRTVHVYFYKSRMFGDKVGYKVPIGVAHIATKVGETRDISIPWIGFGGCFLITVNIPNIDSYSKEISIPLVNIGHDFNFLINFFKMILFEEV